MGTSEEISSSLETQDEINLGVSSNGLHHDHYDEDQQPTEEEVLAKQLESVVLQGNGNGNEVKIEGEVIEEEGLGQEEEKSHFYPLRPYAVDCTFYLKTGTCKFGQNCRFNHPTERAFQDQEKGTEENNGTIFDAGKIDCKYFRTPGGCKYGDACRYNHSVQKVDREGPELNFLGLPVRPSEQECTFYLRTGSCGYGASCRFHHPDPTAARDSEPRNSLANGVYVRGENNTSKMYSCEPGVSRGIADLSHGITSMNGLPYAAMSPYHQVMPQNAGWNQDQANLSLPAKKTPLPHQIVNSFSKKVDPSTHYEQVIQSEEFPIRPGQPDCDFFVKTGDCKYRAACRYNHPVSRDSKLRMPPLSSKGMYSKSKNPELPNSNPGNTRKNGTLPHHQQQQLQNGQYPERPGQSECEYFMKTGNCKFKSACRYHHPRDRVSTSSPCSLNESGLPLRPGSKICRNYELQGTCKYGRNCLFHHPDNGSSSIPVDPIPVEDHSSPNGIDVVAADLDSPAAGNGVPVQSDWGDGWVM